MDPVPTMMARMEVKERWQRTGRPPKVALTWGSPVAVDPIEPAPIHPDPSKKAKKKRRVDPRPDPDEENAKWLLDQQEKVLKTSGSEGTV
jgi:hypothetical protein